jgi:copper chaperone CopZ
MSEAVLQVCTMKDPLCAQGVEQKLLALPGVQHAHTNAVNGTTTVHYDEKTVTLSELEAVIDDCGLRCHGESLPLHYGGHVVHSMPAEAGEEQMGLDHGAMDHVADEHADHEMDHDHGAARPWTMRPMEAMQA